MLTTALVHPPLLAAIARCGHGSQVLIADGNFPYATVGGPNATLIHLNVAPGLLTVDQVLDPLLTVTRFESARVMTAPGGAAINAHEGYRARLGAEVELSGLDRFGFYEAVRTADVGLVVATGDERAYANLLLTVGVAAVAPSSR